MRLLIVGAGATGAYFGGRLAEAGRDVTFLVRPERAAQLAANGLNVKSPNGNISLAPNTVTAADLRDPFDAILLTVKAFALDRAMGDFAPAVGPGTMILPFLNGMRHMDRLEARFGREPIVGCVCKVASSLDADGNVIQLAPFHELAYGERSGASTPRTERLDAALKGAKFDARLSSSIEVEMWEKWVLLSTLGAITCLMRGTVGEIVAAPGGAEYINAALDEIVRIAGAVGQAPRGPFLQAARAQLTTPGSGFASSMFRDMQKGASVEAEQILGDLIQRGSDAGISAPLLSAAYAHLAVYQARIGKIS